MMSNLFSIFDPSSSICFSLNWLIFFLFVLIFPINYYYYSSLYIFSHEFLLKNLFNEFSLLMSSLISVLLFVSLMYMIFIYNFMGLFSYVFTLTSHLSFTLSLALPLWLSPLLFGWINKYKIMFAHLVPLGTPNMLMVFMVLIETISQLIRPITLAVRLCANMIAGHLLLCLMGSLGNKLNIILLNFLVVIQLMLYMLELGVSLIQSYVFSVLCLLYSNEVQ